jgi:hypothetical protein
MYFLYLPAPGCDCSLRCVVPPGVYTVYYLEYWVVSLVMHVVYICDIFLMSLSVFPFFNFL